MDGFPSQDFIVEWIRNAIQLPNLNPYQIKRTVQILLIQAKKNIDKPKMIVPVSEIKDVQLKKVPQTQLYRSRDKGWIKEVDKKVEVELKDLEFLLNYFDYQRLITEGDESKLKKYRNIKKRYGFK